MDGLPLPAHVDLDAVGFVWRVPYEELAEAAAAWRARHRLQPAARDACRIALIAVDVQNTFCIPGFELYVGGRSGTEQQMEAVPERHSGPAMHGHRRVGDQRPAFGIRRIHLG